MGTFPPFSAQTEVQVTAQAEAICAESDSLKKPVPPHKGEAPLADAEHVHQLDRIKDAHLWPNSVAGNKGLADYRHFVRPWGRCTQRSLWSTSCMSFRTMLSGNMFKVYPSI